MVHHCLASLIAGYQRHEYHNYVKSQREQKANFLLRRLQDAGFVTSHYEDGQNNDLFSSGESVWSPRGASLQSGSPPALYFSKPSQWARFRMFNERDPTCWNEESANKVSIPCWKTDMSIYLPRKKRTLQHRIVGSAFWECVCHELFVMRHRLVL
jgi:hypothetical protein